MERYNLKQVEDWTVAREEAVRLLAGTRNGGLRIIATDNDEIRVFAEKTVSASDEQAAHAFMETVRVEHHREGDTWRVEATWQDPRPREVHGVGVGMEIYVPAQMLVEAETKNGQIEAGGNAGLRLHTSNGGVEISSCRGDIDARTSNGRIEIRQAQGKVNAHTSNGAIVADVVQASNPPQIELITSNGAIQVALPQSISARLEAQTSNGAISLGSGDEAVSKKHRNHLETTLGNGDGRITLRTSNGRIAIQLSTSAVQQDALV